MSLLILLILSAFVAYRGMQAGVYPVLNRCLMGAVAIAAGAGFAQPLAQPLRGLIPSAGPYLNSACLLTIALVAYAVQRALAELYLPERQVTVPEYIDRIGGTVVGFLGGLMLLGFLALVILKLPQPAWGAGLWPGLEPAADVAVRAIRFVGLFAGTDELILLENIAP